MIFSGFLFILWFVVWMALSWPPETKDVIAGALVSLFVTFMTIDVIGRKAVASGKNIGILGWASRIVWFICYLIVFVWECLRANIDVAYRVIHPDLPIKPGTVRVKVSLTSDIGLTFLANSITLTPGTTTVDVDKERGFIYVHMLYVKDDRAAPKVVTKFENILKRIFE